MSMNIADLIATLQKYADINPNAKVYVPGQILTTNLIDPVQVKATSNNGYSKNTSVIPNTPDDFDVILLGTTSERKVTTMHNSIMNIHDTLQLLQNRIHKFILEHTEQHGSVSNQQISDDLAKHLTRNYTEITETIYYFDALHVYIGNGLFKTFKDLSIHSGWEFLFQQHPYCRNLMVSQMSHIDFINMFGGIGDTVKTALDNIVESKTIKKRYPSVKPPFPPLVRKNTN